MRRLVPGQRIEHRLPTSTQCRRHVVLRAPDRQRCHDVKDYVGRCQTTAGIKRFKFIADFDVTDGPAMTAYHALGHDIFELASKSIEFTGCQDILLQRMLDPDVTNMRAIRPRGARDRLAAWSREQNHDQSNTPIQLHVPMPMRIV